MVRAWYMSNRQDLDQREPNMLEPCEFVSLEQLDRLGVRYWHFDAATYEQDAEFLAVKRDRNYTYQDLIEISPEKLENYELKLKSFFDEHIHTDEEIRFVLAGSGYFDVRDLQDRWIRIEVLEGDMIVLPAGMYHRFTLDSNNYIKALRLFVGEPIWTPYSRSQLAADKQPFVDDYRRRVGGSPIATSS